MSEMCPQCGAPIDPGASECKFCGEKLAVRQVVQQMQQPQQVVYAQQPQQVVYSQPQVVYAQQPVYSTAINPAWPIKNKTTAGILAIFLGGLGVHKFYLGKTGAGILYLLFCWTYIPEILGIIEGIMYLTSNDENFMIKNQVRIG